MKRYDQENKKKKETENVSKITQLSSFPGLIIREKEPANYEYPFPMLNDFITPDNQFFVRTHFPVPDMSDKDWQLTITGKIENEYSINYDELRKLPSKTVVATLECAGNGRANMVPKMKGLLWEQGAVGNAKWTGVSLSVLLEMAGIKSDTIEVILEGADKGAINEEPKSPGEIHFARSLTLTKALQEEVLIVYQMNGKNLTPIHGYPVRAIVPGWYGMASVKWLTKIIVVNKPFDGYWQTLEYAYWSRTDGHPSLKPVSEVQVKAQIARPALNELIEKDTTYTITGAAWSGEEAIEKVEISINEGKSWEVVDLTSQPMPHSWVLWEYNWQVPNKPSKYKLMAKATDSAGNTQPKEHDADRRTYMINKITEQEVDVQ